MPGDGQQEVYKEHAAECLEIARKTDNREGKIALLDIARAWLALADQHDKNKQTMLLPFADDYSLPKAKKGAT